MRTSLTALLGALAFLLAPHDARAGAAWGDVSLKSDDVRVEIDGAGRAEITHTIGLHVAAKKFRAFTLEGVDDGLEPPADAATLAGRDGPGWPAVATDAKGQPVDAFVEPVAAHGTDPRKLRVRLGVDGVGRGDFTVRVRYRLDLLHHATFVREGAMAKLAWATPRWPEGYDGARVVFAFPSAPTEAKVTIADAEGDGEHATDGVAIVAVRRGPTQDEVEITRPHVPQGDSTRLVLRLDPKSFPGVPSLDVAPAVTAPSPAALDTRRRRIALAIAAGLSAAVAFALVRKRDHDAIAARFRPFLPLPDMARAALFSGTTGLGVLATWAGRPIAGAAAIAVAIAAATLRAPLPDSASRPTGRWLAIPEAAVPARARRVLGPFDLAGRVARVALGLIVVAVAGAFVLLVRQGVAGALALAVSSAVLVPLFATGRGAQQPPDRVGDAWARLRPIAKALSAAGHKVRVVARTVTKPTPRIDEVRLRVDASSHGLRAIEVGCGIVHTSGGATLVPEVLARITAGSAAAVAAAEKSAADPSCALLLGRGEDERVLAVRPGDTGAGAIASAVELCLALGSVESESPAPAAAALHGFALTAERRGA